MEWWNGILEWNTGILEWNSYMRRTVFVACVRCLSVQQLFRRSDQWRKTKHAVALTLLLSLTVTKVVHCKNYIGCFNHRVVTLGADKLETVVISLEV